MRIMVKKCLLSLLLVAMPCVYATPQLELVDDLKALGSEAKESNQIVVVLVTQPGCHYCEYVKSTHLEPMIRKGELADIAIVRELDLAGIAFTDFSGDSIEPGKFAQRYNAGFSPSVLFLSADGKELYKPIIGVGNREFYGYYLEKAILKSKAKSKSKIEG